MKVAKDDEEYIEWTPYINTRHRITELPPDDDTAAPPRSMKEQQIQKAARNSWFGAWKNSKVGRGTTSVFEALKLSLAEKEKLETALSQFQKWNQKLKKLAPPLIDSGLYKSDLGHSMKLLDDPRYELLKPHLLVRQICQTSQTGKR
jgi:hypothetical protein